MSIIGRTIEWKVQSENRVGIVIDKFLNGYNQASSSTVYLVADPVTGQVQTVFPATIKKIFPTKEATHISNQNALDEMLGRVELHTTTSSSTLTDDDLPF